MCSSNLQRAWRRQKFASCSDHSFGAQCVDLCDVETERCKMLARVGGQGRRGGGGRGVGIRETETCTGDALPGRGVVAVELVHEFTRYQMRMRENFRHRHYASSWNAGLGKL